MHNLSIETKLLISFIISAIISAFLSIVEYYAQMFIENRVFVILIFSSFIADVILGAWRHLKSHDFSFKELFTKALTKIAISFLSMILFNAMAGVEGIGDTPLKMWLLMVGKLLNIIYISGSAFNNMYYITNKQFPPYAWISRMKEFNKTLDTSKFTNNQNTQNEQ